MPPLTGTAGLLIVTRRPEFAHDAASSTFTMTSLQIITTGSYPPQSSLNFVTFVTQNYYLISAHVILSSEVEKKLFFCE